MNARAYTWAMQILQFDLDGEYVELHILLKLCGLADSGGMGKQIVASGVVLVDGAQELRKTAKIRAGQVVRIEDQIEIQVLARRSTPQGGDGAVSTKPLAAMPPKRG